MLFSRILVASVSADPLMVPDDEFDAFEPSLANELACRADHMQPVGLSQYCYEGVWMRVKQTAELTFPLRNIQSSHVN